LGHKNVRIYDGSLHQWTQYAANPMTKAVNLMDKDTNTDVLILKVR